MSLPLCSDTFMKTTEPFGCLFPLTGPTMTGSDAAELDAHADGLPLLACSLGHASAESSNRKGVWRFLGLA